MVSFGLATAVADPPPGLAAGTPHVIRDRAHLIDHHLMLLVTAGRGFTWVDFEGHRCRPGTLLWARPGQVVRCERGFDVAAVAWDPEFLPRVLNVDDPFGPTGWQLSGEDEDAVIDEVSQLVVDCDRYRDGEAAIELLRHQLAVLVLRVMLVPPAEPEQAATADDETFVRFRSQVEDGYASCRRVEDYAGRLGCSVRTLTRACLSRTGRTAKQVIDDRVALQAKRLLAGTRLPIGAIGERLGFPGQTHFGRFFLREVGCTPGAFRAGAAAGARPPAR